MAAVVAEKDEIKERADGSECAASALACFCATINAAAMKGSLGNADSSLGSENDGHGAAGNDGVAAVVSGESSGRFIKGSGTGAAILLPWRDWSGTRAYVDIRDGDNCLHRAGVDGARE